MSVRLTAILIRHIPVDVPIIYRCKNISGGTRSVLRVLDQCMIDRPFPHLVLALRYHVATWINDALNNVGVVPSPRRPRINQSNGRSSHTVLSREGRCGRV